MGSVRVDKLFGGIHTKRLERGTHDEQGCVPDRIEAAVDTPFETLLGVPEAAELLHMHPKTLQGLARAGSIPCVRVGKYWLFRASWLDAWVENQLISDHQSRRAS
jgi:excisionase family DNA binding protein